MPRLRLPPTPASSSEIHGRDGLKQLTSPHLALELPPPALRDTIASQLGNQRAIISPHSDSNYPTQAAESVKSNPRNSNAKSATKEDSFTLPPPPTRSRKIIQMKPGSTDETTQTKKQLQTLTKAAAASAAGGVRTNTGSNTGGNSAAQSKKKPTTPNNAAGRKIARKTAHSLIERRRRSKMNEEFATLKGLIPACTGEMHKLAILQASVEYVRYLQECVETLKSQHEKDSERMGTGGTFLPSIREFHPTFHEDESPEDVEMPDEDAESPASMRLPHDFSKSRHISISPAILPRQHESMEQQHDHHGHGSCSSSVSTEYQHSYGTPNSWNVSSATASPCFDPLSSGGQGSAIGSALTSPALPPQNDLDQEAMAALMMLNSDRRGSITPKSNNVRGLSVRDLLSS